MGEEVAIGATIAAGLEALLDAFSAELVVALDTFFSPAAEGVPSLPAPAALIDAAPKVAVASAAGMDDADVEAPEQLRSYNGVSLKVVPTTPKLGFGVVGKASCSVNHQVLVLPKSRPHPTWSQYIFAFVVFATASPKVSPLTGQPVSVTQTGLPPATPTVAWKAASNKEYPLPLVHFDQHSSLQIVN